MEVDGTPCFEELVVFLGITPSTSMLVSRMELELAHHIHLSLGLVAIH